MFRRLQDGSVQGVLTDWEYVSTLNIRFKSQLDDTRTTAFMALGLLENNPPNEYLERFDYESLFYVIFLVCLGYPFQTEDSSLLPYDFLLTYNQWNSPDLDVARMSKFNYISNHFLEDSPSNFLEKHHSLYMDWIVPLKSMFAWGYMNSKEPICESSDNSSKSESESESESGAETDEGEWALEGTETETEEQEATRDL